MADILIRRRGLVVSVITDIGGNLRIMGNFVVNAVIVIAVVLTAEADFIRRNGVGGGFARDTVNGICTGGRTTCFAAECASRSHRLDFAVIQHGFRR